MKILLSVKTLYRRNGGPTAVICSYAQALAKLGNDVEIITDGCDVPLPMGVKSIVLRKDLKIRLCEYVEKFDVVHDNGVWLLFNHMIVRAARLKKKMLFISPHGGLMPWIFKKGFIKKKVAWWCYQKWDLNACDGIFTTVEIERAAVLQLGYKGKIHMHPNGVDAPGEYCRKIEGDKKVAIFVGRIHPTKGIQDLIAAWISLNPTDWDLHIIGPDEVGMQHDLEMLCKKAELCGMVKWLGMLSGDEKTKVFLNADLLILPSYSENFGLVVVEALLMGVPVLATTTTPWKVLVDEGIGWNTKPGAENIANTLKCILSLQKKQLHEIGAKGRLWANGRFDWVSIASEMMKSYCEHTHTL